MKLRTTFLNLAVIAEPLARRGDRVPRVRRRMRGWRSRRQQQLAAYHLRRCPSWTISRPGCRPGQDGTIPIGLNTFADPNSTAAISTTDAAPAPSVPGHGDGNHVLKLDLNVVAWAGVTHAFENAGATAWVTQDWSAYEGISF